MSDCPLCSISDETLKMLDKRPREDFCEICKMKLNEKAIHKYDRGFCSESCLNVYETRSKEVN